MHRNTVPRPASKLWARGVIADAIEEAIDNDVREPSIEAVRKDCLVHDLIPHLFTLLESSSEANNTAHTHKLVKTILLDGYTRKSDMGEPGLGCEAWTETTCAETSSDILYLSDPAHRERGAVNRERWLFNFKTQAMVYASIRFALLEMDRLGLVPKVARKGDQITILHGLSVPVV